MCIHQRHCAVSDFVLFNRNLSTHLSVSKMSIRIFWWSDPFLIKACLGCTAEWTGDHLRCVQMLWSQFENGCVWAFSGYLYVFDSSGHRVDFIVWKLYGVSDWADVSRAVCLCRVWEISCWDPCCAAVSQVGVPAPLPLSSRQLNRHVSRCKDADYRENSRKGNKYLFAINICFWAKVHRVKHCIYFTQWVKIDHFKGEFLHKTRVLYDMEYSVLPQFFGRIYTFILLSGLCPLMFGH